jgi:hypothetical protein
MGGMAVNGDSHFRNVGSRSTALVPISGAEPFALEGLEGLVKHMAVSREFDNVINRKLVLNWIVVNRKVMLLA